MMRSAVSRSTLLVAGLIILAYASLAAMAASCAMHPVDPDSSHAHHGSHEAPPYNDNALCTWACKATSDTGLVTDPPALSAGAVARLVASSPNQVLPSPSPTQLRSRAPPSVSFVPIG
ncbi:MAG: hypothetical protein ACREJN_05115 [Nitrospiraceae bacterium]